MFIVIGELHLTVDCPCRDNRSIKILSILIVLYIYIIHSLSCARDDLNAPFELLFQAQYFEAFKSKISSGSLHFHIYPFRCFWNKA